MSSPYDKSLSKMERMSAFLEYAFTGSNSRNAEFDKGLARGHGKSESMSASDILELIRRQWPSATSKDAEDAVKDLMSLAVRDCPTPAKFSMLANCLKIRRDPPEPPAVTSNPRLLPREDLGHKKPGTCRKCGTRVRNVNRHKNESHTGEQCRMTVLKRILEE